MRPPQETDRERANALMMAALDDELDAAGRRELDALLATNPALQDEFARFKRVKEVTSMMTLRQPSEEVWDGYWKSVTRRAERSVAWMLIGLGSILLAGWLLWQAVDGLLRDTDTPVLVRAALAALLAGGLVLLGSVVRERLFTRRHDPYDREVTR
jgi:anti-sigma factor RsiW